MQSIKLTGAKVNLGAYFGYYGLSYYFSWVVLPFSGFLLLVMGCYRCTHHFFYNLSVKIKMVCRMVIILENCTLVGKIAVIIINFVKDTLVGTNEIIFTTFNKNTLDGNNYF